MAIKPHEPRKGLMHSLRSAIRMSIPVDVRAKMHFNIKVERGRDRIELPNHRGIPEKFESVPELPAGQHGIYYKLGRNGKLELDKNGNPDNLTLYLYTNGKMKNLDEVDKNTAKEIHKQLGTLREYKRKLSAERLERIKARISSGAQSVLLNINFLIDHVREQIGLEARKPKPQQREPQVIHHEERIEVREETPEPEEEIEKPPKAVKEIKTKPAPRPTKRKEKPKPAEKKPARTRTRTPVSPRDKEEGILKAIEKETSTKPVPKSGDSPQYKKAMGIFKTIPEEHRRNFTVLYSRTMKHPTISAKLIQVAKGKNISLENYHLELLEKVAKEFANILKESKTTGANIFTLTAKAYQKIVEGDLARLK